MKPVGAQRVYRSTKPIDVLRVAHVLIHKLVRPAVNLAFSLSMQRPEPFGRRLRVGVLGLDIFGPSVTLMGLQHTDEPPSTAGTPHVPYFAF